MEPQVNASKRSPETEPRMHANGREAGPGMEPQVNASKRNPEREPQMNATGNLWSLS